jgi:hypothetical protein
MSDQDHPAVFAMLPNSRGLELLKIDSDLLKMFLKLFIIGGSHRKEILRKVD